MPYRKNSRFYKLINYVASYNEKYPNEEIPCRPCIQTSYNKTVVSSDSSSARVSRSYRISELLNTRGWCPRYGNYYLGKPLNVNYLGRTEGMPGGSGSPPVNKFN